MARPTSEDLRNAQQYANQRIKLLYIKKMFNKFPHITSWLEYKVSRANPKSDYNYPEKFKPRAIFVETKITKKLCEGKLSCNQFTGIPKNDGICEVNQEAANYRVGDGGKVGEQRAGIHYDVHCQPACYHLKERTGPNDKDVHSFPLRYFNNQCTIINPALLKWMEFPYFRSETIYEHRVNDLPAGFNRSIAPSSLTTSGLNYEYNKIYCDSFFDKFDDVKKNCSTPWYEIIGNAIVGEYIIKLCKAAHRAQINGNWNDLPPTADLPTVPTLDPKKKMKLRDWYNDINLSFKCPDPEMNLAEDTPKHPLNREKKLEELKTIEDSLKKPLVSVGEWHEIKTEKLTKNIKSHRTRRQAKIPTDSSIAKDPFLKIFMNFAKMFLDPNMYRDLAIFIGTQSLAKMLKKLEIYMTKELGPKLFAQFMETKLMTSIFGEVIKGTIEHISTSLVTKVCFEFASRIAFLLNPLTAMFDWALVLTMMMDMILTFVDPLNLNKKYPEGYLENLIISSEHTLKKQLNMTEPVIKFEIFVQMLLTQEEVGEISLHSWRYINEYLAALDYNSEGSIIIHDEEKDAHEVITHYYENNQDEIEKVHLFTENDIELYEHDHMCRMKLIDKVKRAYWLSGIGLIAAIIKENIIISYVLVILTSILVYIQYLVAEIKDFTDIEFYFQWI